MESVQSTSQYARRLPIITFRFKSLRARLFVFILGLLGFVLASVYYSVNKAYESSATSNVAEALSVTANIFLRTLDERDQLLRDKGFLLSKDYAVKPVFESGDHLTILSTLENYKHRIGADVLMLTDLEGGLIADTLHPDLQGEDTHLQPLIEKAMENEYGTASAIQMIDGTAYQMVVVLHFNPEPSSWIVMGFEINNALASSQQEQTNSEVSLFWVGPGRDLLATTLGSELSDELIQTLNRQAMGDRDVHLINMKGEEYLTKTVLVQSGNLGQVEVVLQRSLDAALLPFLQLQNEILTLFGIGIVVSLIGAVIIARGISQPVELLVKAAARIKEGDYTKGVIVKSRDEIGTLAKSFNHMVKGLAERDQVRNLLGKVVSPQIAQELLTKEIQLGGEEREVTVLFSDVRNFTSFSENRHPREILDLLNRYLTRMSRAIEGQGGVIDKYIGDAVMALFGAPLRMEEGPDKAVMSALEMIQQLSLLNDDLHSEGKPPIEIGIGINTGVVVAGNMGSKTRLNYTVIGDGVNLASRLESLTKFYGVKILVSQATQKQSKSFVFRELDKVRVKGKKEPVSIYEAIGTLSDMSESERDRVDRFHGALHDYRERNWTKALNGFNGLAKEAPEKVYQIYIERIGHFLKHPPAEDWDCTYDFLEK